MKNKTNTIVSLILLLAIQVVSAQKIKEEVQSYQRSSLHNVLVVGDAFDNSDIVSNAYQTWPFPDKYNDHRIDLNSLSLSDFRLTDEEIERLGIKKSGAGKLISGAASDATAGIIADNSQVKYEIDKFIATKKIPFEMVNKWFALDQFDQENYNPLTLIGERGAYSASEQDKAVAATTVRGVTDLKNTGKFLIKNTFVVFTKLNFVSNEAVALAVKAVSDAAANELSGLPRDMALKLSEKTYTKTREGYSVWTTAWLYRLDWTQESFLALGNLMGKKKNQGDAVDFSTLAVDFEFIGEEKATSLVTFSLKEKRSEQQIIELSTIRNLDKVYAKLQKKYDIFKPKSPIIIEDGKIYAQIGMKEGLEGGESFEVLEAIADPETYEMIGYKKIATIKVDKKQIWDNRFGAGDDTPQDFNMTLFKGKAKKLSSGMLIMQKK
tara:strand:- start:3409 stop:4719 length:1311 start_codon:yes stop_codon:yes gene_type:complete